MTITLVPKGRGRWRQMTMVLDDVRGGLFIRAGQTIFLGGLVWRIARVMP